MSLKTTTRLLFALVCSLSGAAAHAADWQVPTPEELSMKTQAGAPDAAAVYLYRDEQADDHLHEHSLYVRLKVLTEEGKRYADVEIPYERRGFSIGAVAGRTIHSDGTIIPFTGKPYDKMLVKTAKYKYQAKVFSMPDVEVGSILEYKYQLRYDDSSLYPPTWYIQSELYLRKGHYRYTPWPIPQGGSVIVGRSQAASSIIWYPILPKGAAIKHVVPPTAGALNQLIDHYDLDVDSIPAEPREEYLPPLHSLSYRVYFQYSAYDKREEFWAKEGKYWSKQADKFMTSGPGVTGVVSRVTAPSDTPEQKLRKLYAEVMTYENTDFTRRQSAAEQQAEGLKDVKSADDIVARKRGSSEELTMLFVTLARSAGLKAYFMMGTSREEEIFNSNVLRMDQLDSPLAIVNINGKEQYFDPGQRYCAYGQLRWDHTEIGGIRQTEGGTELTESPAGVYSDAKTVRLAKLTMDESGQVEGTIQVGYTGDPALAWRQQALKQDEAEVRKDMEEAMRYTLPGGLTVSVDKVLFLDDPTKQLVAKFNVHGPLANATSKRMFVPVEVFEVNERPLFTQAKREVPVYFHHGYQEVDQISLTFPASMEVESAPQSESIKMDQLAVMQEGSVVKGNTLTQMRSFGLGSMIFKVDEYDQLRAFYAKVTHKDQEQAVLKVASHAAGN